MAAYLPPVPLGTPDGKTVGMWSDWYNKIRDLLNGGLTILWSAIDKTGSKLSDIAERPHSQLQSLQGGTAGEYFHLTAAQYAGIGAGNHNNLLGLQGGNTAERYHLTAAQYAALGSGSNHNDLLSIQGGNSTERYHLTSAEHTVVQNTSGTNTGDQTITLTGDVTGSGTGSFAATLATVNSNVGSYGSSTQVATFTVNAKGLITAAGNTTLTPSLSAITGLGTGVATALGINTGTTGSIVLYNGDIGAATGASLTTTGNINSSGGTISSDAGGIYAFKFVPGDALFSAQNFDTTATSNAILEAYSGFGGTPGGDAMVALSTSTKSFTVGLDQSDGNKLKFGWDYRTVGGANTFLTVDSATSVISTVPYKLSLGTSVSRQRITVGTQTATSTATPESIDLGGTYSNVFGQSLKLKLYNDGTNEAGSGYSATGVEYVTPSTKAHNFIVRGFGSQLQVSQYNITTYNTAVATSSTTASVNIGGGLGIAKNIWCGGNFTTTQNNGGMVFHVSAGGVTLPLTASSVHTAFINPSIFSAPSALGVSTPSTLTINGAPTAGTNVTFIGTPRSLNISSGQCYFGGTTASTSNTTGDIVTAGGVGISNATDAVSSTNGGSITTAGGVAIAKKLFVGGISQFTGQTRFTAQKTSNASAVTGDGTYYTVAGFTKISDPGGNLDATTGVFTAPVTGTYLFTFAISLLAMQVTHTGAEIRLVTTPRTITTFYGNLYPSFNVAQIVTHTVEIALAAGDTASVSVNIFNGARVVSIQAVNTTFCGYLLG